MFASFKLYDFEITLPLSKLFMNGCFICKRRLQENRPCILITRSMTDLKVPKFPSVYPLTQETVFSLFSMRREINYNEVEQQ